MATTDDILARYSDESVELELRLVDGDAGPFMLISGGRPALRFLSELLAALADSPELPSSRQLGPDGAGSFHLSPRSNTSIYLQCTE
jgi:hypothetical protein